MKRVLLITDIFPPDIGGPATFIFALANELVPLNFAVTVLCRAEKPTGDTCADNPFRVVRLPRHRGRVGKAQLYAALLREALRHDVIFSNGLERHTEKVCRLLARPYTLKVVGDVAWERARNQGLTRLPIGDFQTAPPATPVVKQWVKWRTSFACHARTVITPSDYLRKLVIGWGALSQRVFTVRNGVRLDEFRGFQPRPRTGSLFNILYVGRLVNWKGLEFLLHAIAPMQDTRLTIVGDGPHERSVRAQAESLDIGRSVQFSGTLQRQETLRALERAHVLVLPSEYEGMSHTLLEACAAAVPCVASNCGGNPEVIEHGRSGLLIPYGDVKELRAALEHLKADEDYRFALAVGAKERSRQFDFRTTISETIKLLAP